MRKIALLLSTLALGFVAQAQQVPITAGNLTYTQDFNTLDTSASTNSSVLPTGWSIFEYGSSQTTVNQQYKGTNGSANAGDTYSFGTNGSTERALGALASNSLNSHFGVKFVNNTGAAITGFTVSYKGEQWRLGAANRTNVDSLRFLYSTTATNVSDTTSASYTENTALMFNTPNMAGTAGAVDGNLAGNFTNKTGTVNINIPAGGTLVIKWIDVNIVGTDDALGIDDVSITFIGSTGPINYRPNITALVPANNATNVAANANLQITFDRQIVGRATGNIRIKNVTDQTTITKAGNSADVTVAGNVATITNTGLAIGKSYYVTFDSTAFDTAGFKSYGIYDTTAWKFSVPAPNFRPTISPVYPTDNATSLPANPAATLIMRFSRRVAKGTSGNITIKNETDQQVVTKAVTSADVRLNTNGDTAYVDNVVLTAGKSYHVLVDSVAFDTAGYKVVGITDTTRWNFSVQGPVITVTSLNEQFENSCPAGLPAGWLQYSVTGPTQFWKCNNTTSNYGLVMNGGGANSSTGNEDWLITPKMNLSNMTNAMLAFKAKYRFAGPNMEVKYSTDYTGTGNPNAATWINIPGITFTAADSNVWATKTASLANANGIFVAFKYTSLEQTTSGGAREWSVDSVVVSDVPTGIATINSNHSNLPVQVLGEATNGNVNIAFDLINAGSVNVAIFDLAGRQVYADVLRSIKGKNTVKLAPQTLQSGMYIIRLADGTQQGIARTFIH